MRKGFIIVHCVFLFSTLVLLLTGCKTMSQNEKLDLSNLRCELLVNPEGVDILSPRLSWEIRSDQRNIRQVAYQVIVSSDPERLDNNIGDLWNSGKVVSDQSHLVTYKGKKLESRSRCYWKVKIWSEHGESNWSEPAYWSMGLLNYNDWKGRWIGFDRTFPRDRIDKFSRLSARYFRKEFETSEHEIAHATVYIMGLGLYELYVNGRKIGDQVLAPAPTDYTKNVKYNTFDVTDHMKKGRNAIGTILGNGRYFTMRQNYKPYKIKTFGFPKMLLNLVIEYNDGTIQVIQTDNTWMGTANGPILSNNEYDGEEYDARKEMPGWNNTRYDDTGWLKAEYVEDPGGEYEAQMNENMKVMEILHPVMILKIRPGIHIIDMGQNMVGWIQIKAKGKAGHQVRLRFAETLQENGELFLDNLRDAKVTDLYTFRGEDMEIWEPKFVYHGFRYVEVTGFPGNPTTENFIGKVIYDEMNTTGSFESSNKLINRIYSNAYWGIRGNYKGMPVDCPQRNERQPWLGDRAIGSLGESFIFDNVRLYTKWLNDIEKSQKTDGCIPDVAPAFWRYYSDNMTWPGTYIIIADMLHNQYGDSNPIQHHYGSMKRWMKYMRENYMTKEYIVTQDKYGDWCAPPESLELIHTNDPGRKTDSTLIATAYYYHLLQLMTKFASLKDNQEDIRDFNKLSGRIKEAFNNRFLNKDGSYSNNTVTANLLPLCFGMVPQGKEGIVFEHITEKIIHENQGHISTGLIGTQWLMRGLAQYGRSDIAFQLTVTRTYPGWGYMVENDATTIWELWNGNTADPGMNSHNHVMLLGDLIAWLYEKLGGIETDPENPGFKGIKMNPEFIDSLHFVKATYKTSYGQIKSEWKKDQNHVEWNITIPHNTTAEVYFPVLSGEELLESGKPVDTSYGVKYKRKEKHKEVFEIGSGTYIFSFKL